jgi:hypothetical protein
MARAGGVEPPSDPAKFWQCACRPTERAERYERWGGIGESNTCPLIHSQSPGPLGQYRHNLVAGAALESASAGLQPAATPSQLPRRNPGGQGGNRTHICWVQTSDPPFERLARLRRCDSHARLWLMRPSWNRLQSTPQKNPPATGRRSSPEFGRNGAGWQIRTAFSGLQDRGITGNAYPAGASAENRTPLTGTALRRSTNEPHPLTCNASVCQRTWSGAPDSNRESLASGASGFSRFPSSRYSRRTHLHLPAPGRSYPALSTSKQNKSGGSFGPAAV